MILSAEPISTHEKSILSGMTCFVESEGVFELEIIYTKNFYPLLSLSNLGFPE
jgi:hypothetical protein